MPNLNMIVSSVILAAALVPTQVSVSHATSDVRTKAQCTRYGGYLLGKSVNKKGGYWTCHTPGMDKKCVKQFGKRGYFDVGSGKCKTMTKDEYECMIYEFDWCY